MTITAKQTILAVLVGVLILGSYAFVAPGGAHAAYEDLPAYVKNQMTEMLDHVSDRRDAYSQYRDAYLAQRANWQIEREEVRGAITDVRNCQGDPSPPCDFVRNDFVDAQKAFMTATVSRISSHLDNVDAYLIAHIDDATEAQVATDWVNDIRTELSDSQAKIDALSSASDRSEVKDITAFVRDSFRDTRAVSSAIRGHYVLSTAKKAQEKFTALGERFASEMDELEAAGVDTTNLAALIAAYDAQVADIQGHIDAAQQLYSDIVTDSEVSEEDLATAASNFKERAGSAKAHYKALLASAKEVFQELHALNQ